MSGASEVRVRDMREDELPAVRELTLGAYGAYSRVMEPAAWAGLDRAVRAALDSSGAAERIVAERDGRLVGSVMLFPASSDAYGGVAGPVGAPEVRLLAVAPEGRGRGVGRALLEECVRRARRSGATEVGLHTSRSMAAAIRLYERLGFVRAPEHDFQPEGAELVTAYRLPLGEGD